ncbi:MAG: 2OG-Fe(II) oxygenase [Actinomycetota bacterium]
MASHEPSLAANWIETTTHPIRDRVYANQCRNLLALTGALVLPGFFRSEMLDEVVRHAASRESEAFHANSTHNVYLTPPDSSLPPEHPFNRQVASTKGLLADDQIPADSPLRAVYGDPTFRLFLCRVLDVDAIHPYADELSSINVHFAAEGRELGWHFDNSSFAVTTLMQAPVGGGVFEYVAAVRDADAGDMAFDRVDAVLDGREEPETLRFGPGDLVLFRGRNALHRVTPTVGPVTRMLVVFAFNDQPGIGLSDSALTTFYGRSGRR